MARGRDKREYKEKFKDPYMDKSIYRDPTICPTCGLIFHEKRWIRDEELAHRLREEGVEFYKKDCPACRKIKDNYPLGILEVNAEYVKIKVQELKNLIKNVVEEENIRNPLERIIKMNIDGSYLYVETTTEHLAKKIGNRIRKAFGGKMSVKFSEDQKLVRIEVRE